MLYLSQFRSFKNISSGAIAFILFISVFAGKHISHILYAFEGVDVIFLNKVVKYFCVAILSYFMVKEVLTKKIKVSSPYFYCFILFVFVYLVKLVTYYLSSDYDLNLFKWSLNSLTGAIGFFLLGTYFPRELSKTKGFILVLSIVLMIIIDITYIDLSRFELDLTLVDDKSLHGHYLMWSDTVAIMFLLLVFFLSSWRRYLCILLGFSFVAAFLSRAGLFSFGVGSILGMIIQKDRKGLLIFTIVALVATTLIFNKKTNLRSLKFGISNNSSFVKRVEIAKYGIESIKKNWIVGDFLGQLKNPSPRFIANTFGHYIHNYLSLWRQFGIVVFLGFLFYYFSALKFFIKNNRYSVIIGVALFIIVEISFFRGYTFPYFWFIAGFISKDEIFTKI